MNKPDHPEVRITAKQHVSGSINLYLVDNGVGISEEHQKNLFEPFFTTEHNGTGLGLYLCREICTANKANIRYISNSPLTEGMGTCFCLSFAAVLT